MAITAEHRETIGAMQFRYASELHKGDRFIEFHDAAGEPVVGEVDVVHEFGGTYRVIYWRLWQGGIGRRQMFREHNTDFPVVLVSETAMAPA